MTSTDTAAPDASTRSWWQDRRPVDPFWSVTSLGLGLVSVLIGTIQSVDPTVEHGMVMLVIGATLLAQAGLSVTRPAPGRWNVLVYRVAWIAGVVPLVVAVVVAW